jgi:glucokinase
MDFAPTNDLEIGLLKYLLKQYEHVSYERVCSGIGLPKIYEYLKEIGPDSEPKWLTEKLSKSNNPTAVISAVALDKERSCPICQRTLDIFVSILGAAAGNGALNMMTLGGVYIGGGIPPRILPAFKKRLFMEAFTNKGRFSKLMSQIPVHVILNPKVALLGAASLATI